MDSKKQKRQFWIILTIVFLGFLGVSMPYLIFPSLFVNPDYSILPVSWTQASKALFLGVTLAAYPLGQFIGSPILGALSDDYGRKQLLAASLLLSALSNLITGFSIQYKWLALIVLSRLVAGFMEGNVAIARAMVADIKTISKHKTFGKINATISIAFLLGPFLGGMLTDKALFNGFNTSVPFFLIGVLFIFLAILSATVLEQSEPATPNEKKTAWERINIVKRISKLFTNKQLKFLLITCTLFTLAVDIFYEFGPVYLTVKWKLGPPQLTFYNLVLCLALAIGNGYLPSVFFGNRSHRLPIICSIGAFTIFLIGMVFTSSTLMMALLFGLSGIVIGIVVTLLTVKISDAASDTIQGEVMGTQMSLRVLGDGIICLFGGGLLIFSPKLILAMAALIAVIAMTFYAFKYGKVRNLNIEV